jgi:hypothetical protein
LENQNREDHLADADTDMRIIMMWTLKKLEYKGVDWIYLAQNIV